MSVFWTGDPLARITRPSNAAPRRWRRRHDASFGVMTVTFAIGLAVGGLIVIAVELALASAGVPLFPHRVESFTAAPTSPSVITSESSGGLR